MIPINSLRLWDPYGKDNPLENSVKHIYKVAEQTGVPRSNADLIIAKFFIELSEGATYSTTKCSCGCEIDKSGTDATHEMVRRVLKKSTELKAAQAELFEKQFNRMIGEYIGKIDADYTRENMTPNKHLEAIKSNYFRAIRYYRDNSIIVRWINGLVRNR